MTAVIDMPVADIVVGDRIRKDFGDIDALALSIETVGLLQPIGITPGNVLIFGERRLRAFRFLELPTIPTRVIDIESIVIGEHAENELRKDFSFSERVAIGKALEEGVGNRSGRPSVEKVGTCPPFPDGTKTRELAAVKAGFGSARTYSKAKEIIDRGAPELIKAVDEKKMTINEASKIVHLNPQAQARVANLPRQARKGAVGEANARSTAAKVRSNPMSVVKEPGTSFLRKLLSGAERLAMVAADDGARDRDAIIRMFDADMDWSSLALVAQLNRAEPAILALAQILARNERRRSA